jgi:hypothetical protein
MKKIVHFFLILISFAISCEKSPAPVSLETRSLTRKTKDYEGVLLHDWVQLGYQILKDNMAQGPHAARAYGYIGMTAWESIHGGIPGAKGLAGQVNDYYESAPIDPDREYDWGMVQAAAMRVVFPEIIENITSSQKTAVGLLADLQETQLMAKGVSEEVRNNSKDLGKRIATRIVYRIRRDGRDNIRSINPVLPARTGNTQWYWDGTTLNQKPVEPMWGTLRTFIIDNAQVCEGDPPYSYSTGAGSNFYKDAKEVFEMPRDNAGKSIAYHWDDTPGRTCSAACHWISIAEQLLKAKSARLDECARVYCLMGFTAADVYGHCWYVKYKYNLMRPVTYIREQFDARWKSLIHTPASPGYISAAAAMGGAAPVVLAPVFGNPSFTDRTHLGSALYTPDGGPFILPERAFSSLTAAGEEQALSRIAGGVEFRKSVSEGFAAGKCIGKRISDALVFE